MRRISRWALAFAALALLAPREAFAQVPDRIEEDWRLIVATPDVPGVGPQITTSMCPAADATQNPFVAFDLNYREYPSFAAGGYQAQVWSNNQLVSYSVLAETDQFATANETITWTQRMLLVNGKVVYTIPSGNSTTWGTFGATTIVSFNTSLANLSGYRPATSTANSGVSWQVNNVQELTLVAVRYYSGLTLLSTDSTARTLVSNGAVVTGGSSGSQAFRPASSRFLPMPAALASRRARRDEIALA